MMGLVHTIGYGVKRLDSRMMMLIDKGSEANRKIRTFFLRYQKMIRYNRRRARFEKRCEQIKRNHFKPKWINGRIKRRVVPSPKPDRWSEG
jgi:hypothetical protein